MLAQIVNKISAKRIGAQAALVLMMLCGLVINTDAQEVAKVKFNQAQASSTQTPLWQSYKEVKIGMTAEAAREKLGKPTSEDKEGFFYVFSDNESAQIVIDKEQKVRIISVMFSGDYPNPPSFEGVFGKDEKAEPNADGSIYKLIRYPAEGYWVSYSRLAGEKPLVTVTIQKM